MRGLNKGVTLNAGEIVAMVGSCPTGSMPSMVPSRPVRFPAARPFWKMAHGREQPGPVPAPNGSSGGAHETVPAGSGRTAVCRIS